MARALIVDDAPDLRLLIRTVLARAGFEVVESGSGPEALALIAGGERPDIAIVDVQMPDMDGWDTLAALRRDPATGDLPVILCTVKAGAADNLRAWELGCDGYVTKPFAITDLVDEVRTVIGRSQAERLATRQSRLELARADAGIGG